MKAVAVIPARLGSTRLPRKVLRPIAGVPMLARVYEAARGCKLLADVVVATDSDEVMEFCRQSNIPARMTSPDHRSGTDRVREIAGQIAADVYVNVQGDEPLARPEHLEALLEPMRRAEVEVATLKTPCTVEDAFFPGAVKVVTDTAGRALYFSRSPMPHNRDGLAGVAYFKHLGFYAYRKSALDRFVEWPEGKLEAAERLEQLRFLENGLPIWVAETPYDTVGVDFEADVARVEYILARR